MSIFEERLYVTLMDVDMVGSTAMDVALGQESAADVKLAFRHIAKEEIESNFGTYRSNGDGVFAEFGLTHNTERSALAAVRAALGIVRRLESNEELVARLQARPRARIGIHSGLTLIRADERGVPDFFGTTPDLAARLQANAGANEIWLSEDAFASIRAYVRARKVVPVALRGLNDPIVVYIVETDGELAVPESPPSMDGPPFIGRERELAVLMSAAEGLPGGPERPTVIQVLGPGGVGKTRLLREFRTRLSDRGVRAIAIACDSFSQGVSLGAISAALSRFPGFSLAASAGVDASLEVIGALVRHLKPAAGGVTIFVDDAHLADKSSLQLLQRLAEAGDPHLLLVLSSRHALPELAIDGHGAGAGSGGAVVLDPLGPDEAAALVQAVAGTDALSPEQRGAIVARGAGFPLYLYELALAAQAGSHPDWREKSAIPASLWPAMQARVVPGRAHREALRALSLFEGPIPAPVALAIIDTEDSAILRTFESAGLIRLKGGASGPSCTFAHDLMRSAVYESISPRTRPSLHHSTATVLIERCSAYAAEHPHVVARQFALARAWHAAARYYGLAGDLAQGQGAYLVAEDHYANAFELAEGNADLRLRTGQLLVRVQMVNHGFGHAETVGATLARIGASHG